MLQRLVITLLVFLSLPACTKKSTSGGVEKSKTLVINVGTEPPTLDWNKSMDTTSGDLIFNIMEGLLTYDVTQPELPLTGGLLRLWESRQQGKVWHLTLRKDVKWTDGVELISQHVVDSFERVLNPKTGAKGADIIFMIKNAQDYNKGKIKDFSKVGVKIQGKYQIEIELDKPVGFFPYVLTSQVLIPIRKELIAKHGERWYEPGSIVTLGAYNLAEWKHDSHLVLKRNENYFGEKAKTEKILARIVPEASTAINLFDKGELDIITNLPSVEIQKLSQRKEYRQSPTVAIYYLAFNVRKPPLDDREIRKALVMAIDRHELVKLLGGGKIANESWLPKGVIGYAPDTGVRFNPAEAKKILESKGYGKGKKLPKIVIGFNTNENHKRLLEAVQHQLKKNLGVEVELQNQEWKLYLESLKTNPPNIYRMGWFPDFPDPHRLMEFLQSGSHYNFMGWKNNEYDKLIEEAMTSSDPKVRGELYTRAQKIITEEEFPALTLYTYSIQYLVSERVKNFTVNTLDRKVLRLVELK